MTVQALVDASAHSLVQAAVDARAVAVAIMVAGEPEVTTNHAARLALAGRILQGVAPIHRLTLIVISEANMAAAIEANFETAFNLPAGDIDNRLSSVWTQLALAGF